MELNINSPSYYTQEYGVIDEIYKMCKECREKNYSGLSVESMKNFNITNW